MKRGIAPAIAIGLAVIIFAAPPLKLSKTDEALRKQTVDNAKKYMTAIAYYCADYDDVTPYTSDPKIVAEIVYPYMKSRSITRTLNPKGGIFHFNPSTTRIKIEMIEDPSKTPFIYETYGWNDGKRVVCFWNQIARPVDQNEWNVLRKNLSLKIKKVD